MEIILNDISWRIQSTDKYEAIDRIKVAVEVFAQLKKTNPSLKLSTVEKITGYELAPNYYFGQLFSENDLLSLKYRSAIKTFFTVTNKINEECGEFTIEEYTSKQCGYAFLHNIVVFSLVKRNVFAGEKIEGAYEDEKKHFQKGVLDNISKKGHIGISKHVRIYEQNPKHKINYGWGSEMDLSDEKAQELLNNAIIVNGDSKHLAAMYEGKYYSFRQHLGNCYHGYRDNSLPQYIKNQLNV